MSVGTIDAASLPSAVFSSSGPATVLMSGVLTSAGKCILVRLWQPVTPQQMFDFTLVTHTVPEDVFTAFHTQAVSTHPASHCQMHLMQQLSVAPRCLNDYGPGSHLMFTALSVLVQALSSLFSSISCARALDASRPNPQSELCKCWRWAPSPFPSIEIPAPPQPPANMLDLFRTFFRSSLLISHQEQDFFNCSV